MAGNGNLPKRNLTERELEEYKNQCKGYLCGCHLHGPAGATNDGHCLHDGKYRDGRIETGNADYSHYRAGNCFNYPKSK